MSQIGLAFIVSNGQAVGVSNADFFTLGTTMLFGIPIPILINVMSLLNIDSFYQYLVHGLILLLAVLMDQLKNRGAER